MTGGRTGHRRVVDDPFALRRFLDAQDAGGTHDTALAELRRGTTCPILASEYLASPDRS